MAKFFDSLVEQSVSHPVRIAAERRDGLLDPDEPGALVLHAVVAGAVARVPRPERVERRHPEHPEPDLCDMEARARARGHAPSERRTGKGSDCPRRSATATGRGGPAGVHQKEEHSMPEPSIPGLLAPPTAPPLHPRPSDTRRSGCQT